MEISFEINTEKGDSLVVSLLSSYDFIKEVVNHSGSAEIEIIDVSIIRKSGDGQISVIVLKEIASKISNVLESSPNAILFYYCDSSDPIPGIRSSRSILCQEYRDRLFNLMFARFVGNENPGWRDYRIEATIKGEPQFVHLIYRLDSKDTVDAIGREVLQTFSDIELQK